MARFPAVLRSLLMLALPTSAIAETPTVTTCIVQSAWTSHFLSFRDGPLPRDDQPQIGWLADGITRSFSCRRGFVGCEAELQENGQTVTMALDLDTERGIYIERFTPRDITLPGWEVTWPMACSTVPENANDDRWDIQ